MKKLLAIVLAALLVAAGCTSGDTEAEAPPTTAPVSAAEEEAADEPSTPSEETAPSEDASAPAEEADAPSEEEAPPPEDDQADAPEEPEESPFVDQTLEGRAPGITDDTIKVGITYPNLASVTAINVDHGDYEATFLALIAELNANGGINGRAIEPIFGPISFGAEADADAICVKLTEDDPVFVVVGFFLGDAPACYVEQQETAIIGGMMSPDLLERARAPWYTWEGGSDFEAGAVDKFAQEGLFDVPFAVYASIDNEPFLNDVILTKLTELGYEPVEVAVMDAPADDEVASDAQNAVILQRFEVAGAEAILVPRTDSLGVARALERTGYRPQLIMTSSSAILAFISDDADRDYSVLNDAVAAGGFGPEGAVYEEADMQGCLEITTAAGVEALHPDDHEEGPNHAVSLQFACISLTLFTAIATRAGPNLNYATFQAAGDTIGHIKLPGNPEPYLYGPPPLADGDPPIFIWRWDPEVQELVIDLG